MANNNEGTDEYVDEFTDDHDYQARLQEMEAKMKEVEEREKEVTEKIRQECKAEMDERLALLTSRIDSNLTDRMYNMEDRYKNHTSEIVAIKQTEVLRSNKVLREVARGLGADWRFIFRFVMAGFPKEVIDIEMEKLERVKPFMQAYKALLTWRDYKAEEFDIRQLIKALDDNLKTELAYMARDIMESEGESLLTMHSIGKGIASGVQEDEDADAAAGEVQETGDTNGVSERKKILNDGEATDGPLGDTKLLQVARKLGKEWPSIAKELELPEEEVEELKEITDETMAAFRMLWSWRDQNSSKKEEDLVSQIISVFKKSGRTELAQIFVKESNA